MEPSACHVGKETHEGRLLRSTAGRLPHRTGEQCSITHLFRQPDVIHSESVRCHSSARGLCHDALSRTQKDAFWVKLALQYSFVKRSDIRRFSHLNASPSRFAMTDIKIVLQRNIFVKWLKTVAGTLDTASWRGRKSLSGVAGNVVAIGSRGCRLCQSFVDDPRTS